jgi:peptide/nickel transport system substrate-binding protein
MLAALLALLVAALSGAPASARSGAERVRLPFPAYDGTLTPYTFSLGYPLVTLVYDTLLWRDAGAIPRPWLARSLARSAAGRRVTVRLRDGLRWQDGRPLTAADVAFTFRFVATHPQARFTPQLADIRAVRATGRLTVAFDLRRPSTGFEDQPLADVPILPRHLWRDLPPGQIAPRGLPVGSGPYRLVSAGRRRGYVFRANRGYFRGAPLVGVIRVPIIGEAERTYAALLARQVDMVPLPLTARAAADVGANLGLGLRQGTSYSGTMLVLNLRRPPFDRLAARRAVSAALDLGRISAAVAPAVAADRGFLHPASRWASGAPLHRFDPQPAAAARRAVGAATIGVLAPDNDPVRLEAGRRVLQALRAAGIRATLKARTRAQLDRALGAGGRRPSFDAAIDVIPPLVSYDPDGLTRLFGSDPAQAPLNAGGYRSAAFDAAARRTASAPSRSARRAATRAELAVLAREVPAVALFFSRGRFGIRPAIYDGWVFVQGTGILDKQSFLPGTAAEPAPPARGEPAAGTSGSGAGGVGLLDVVSGVVLAIAVMLALAGLVVGRRRRRS